MKESADSQFSQVGNEVTAVKTDVATTKSELEKTVADLRRATGEIDGHSVLIATNHKELKALQALGERNYVQFTIQKSKQPQKVGDVSILLKRADPKKNRYTIELTADDKTTEKKDRGINEPLQFMTSKAKQPYELVVNDVKKDSIVGYLSIPKVLNTRNLRRVSVQPRKPARPLYPERRKSRRGNLPAVSLATSSFVPGAGGSMASKVSGISTRWIWPRERTRSTISWPK